MILVLRESTAAFPLKLPVARSLRYKPFTVTDDSPIYRSGMGIRDLRPEYI
jgi:hypothetical protein